MNKMFDFVKFLKKSLIISACLLLAGIIMSVVFGVDFDISFAGGSRFTYSYTGSVEADGVADAINGVLGVKPVVSGSSDYSSSSEKLVITFSGDITAQVDEEAVKKLNAEADKTASESAPADSENTASSETDSENSSGTSSESQDNAESSSGASGDENSETMVAVQNAITNILKDKFPDNGFALSESNTVNPTLAGSFLIKSLFAVMLAVILVIVYIGIRFRKIGGITAGISTLIALIHDVLIAFFICVIFSLDIDANFFAVVLTLFGYSLNNTIIVFDRVRENEKYFPSLSVRELVNKSINETLSRSIVTSLTTLSAILAIVIVAEFFGVSTLRSFAIPMAFGIVSGCYTSMFLAGPIWVKWVEHRQSKKAVKEK